MHDLYFDCVSEFDLFNFETQGSSARMSSFVGAIAIADLVKTTLGPKGMDKILQSVSLVIVPIVAKLCVVLFSNAVVVYVRFIIICVH